MIFSTLFFFFSITQAGRDLDIPRPPKCFLEGMNACIREHQGHAQGLLVRIEETQREVNIKADELRITDVNVNNMQLDAQKMQEQMRLIQLELDFLKSSSRVILPSIKILDSSLDISYWFDSTIEDIDWLEVSPQARQKTLSQNRADLNATIPKLSAQLSQTSQTKEILQILLNNLNAHLQMLQREYQTNIYQVNSGCKERYCSQEL